MDIVTPPMENLLSKVDSRYTLVVLAAKRARQLLDGTESKVEVRTTKNVTKAMEEVAEGKITYERTKVSLK
ncbi:MAG: DNA-directed RNA polymerase subunit omega [Schwartzia sp.]|nr:DNA-directed RNA polymerase subunit omega [Schwartzia sp. (in: firmicutes)]